MNLAENCAGRFHAHGRRHEQPHDLHPCREAKSRVSGHRPLMHHAIEFVTRSAGSMRVSARTRVLNAPTDHVSRPSCRAGDVRSDSDGP